MNGRPSGVVADGASCNTKGPGFESRVRHGCQTVCPWPLLRLCGSALKTGRREVPGSIPARACRPNYSEFSVVFSETRLNTGLKKTPHGEHPTHRPRSPVRQSALIPTTTTKMNEL